MGTTNFKIMTVCGNRKATQITYAEDRTEPVQIEIYQKQNYRYTRSVSIVCQEQANGILSVLVSPLGFDTVEVISERDRNKL